MSTQGTNQLTVFENGQAKISEAGQYSRLTGSTSAIKSGPGVLIGIFVSSSTSGTLKIYDSLTQANTIIVNTTATLVGGTFYRIPARFTTGLSITIGGTIDFTVFYD
jgi:hypothetical protein